MTAPTMRHWTLAFALVSVFALGHISGLWRSATSSADEPPVASETGDTPSSGLDATRTTWPAAAVGAAATGAVDDLSRLTADERRVIEIFRDVSPSVVNIATLALRRSSFFSLDVYEIPAGTGSGFVWNDQGHVVTNYHVIQNGRRFVVTLGDEDYDAQLIGAAPHKDLAVLEVDAPREVLRPVMLGTSGDLVVGQRVLAIGNPFGLDQTLTVGVVSALGRELKSPAGLPIRDVVQTDAAINPGNSGGPLLDSSGRLIGVNTAIFSPSGASAGIGFAVPVDAVKRLVPQLIRYGQPIQPGIGIDLVSDRVARRFRLEGVIVRTVRRGGPADAAGIPGSTRDPARRRARRSHRRGRRRTDPLDRGLGPRLRGDRRRRNDQAHAGARQPATRGRGRAGAGSAVGPASQRLTSRWCACRPRRSWRSSRGCSNCSCPSGCRSVRPAAGLSPWPGRRCPRRSPR